MLILNLGCGSPDKRSWHPLDGCVNRDPGYDGWRFEDGLGEYADGSVDGISVSHSIMYVALSDWPAVFAEFARVLRDGGVIRITEDSTDDTRSRTHPKGWHDVVTLTSASLVKRHLEGAGLIAHDCAPDETRFESDILIQQFHGDPPHVFHCEGQRMTRVLFQPHSDDGALFAAFTILRYRPAVVTCFGSAGDYGSTEMRAKENEDGMSVLGGDPCFQWNGENLTEKMREFDARFKPSLVFACHPRTSHPDHIACALSAAEVFGDRLRTYHTYELRDGLPHKVTGHLVPYEPDWVHAKLRALVRYESQARHPRACGFFLWDMNEWSGETSE